MSAPSAEVEVPGIGIISFANFEDHGGYNVLKNTAIDAVGMALEGDTTDTRILVAPGVYLGPISYTVNIQINSPTLAPNYDFFDLNDKGFSYNGNFEEHGVLWLYQTHTPSDDEYVANWTAFIAVMERVREIFSLGAKVHIATRLARMATIQIDNTFITADDLDVLRDTNKLLTDIGAAMVPS